MEPPHGYRKLAVVVALALGAGACSAPMGGGADDGHDSVADAPPITPVFSTGPVGTGDGTNFDAVALFFAPRFYQGVGGLADLIAPSTYDLDWSALNNWENLGAYPLKAYVYVSAVEDANRYFLFYGVFHPRDWCDYVACSGFCGTFGCDYHENDLEGVMLTVDKRLANGTWPFGQVVTAETIYHNDDYKRYYNCYPDGWTNYVAPAGDFGGGQWTGCFTFHTVSVGTSPNPPGRIGIYIQTRGHGQFIIPGPVTSWNDGAGVVYDPSGTAPPSVPVYPFSGTQNATYRLQWLHRPDANVPSFSLWSKRFDTSHNPFLLWGPTGPHDVSYAKLFSGDNGSAPAATAPWAYDHDQQPATHPGDWHNHPAWAWAMHYVPTGPSSYLYEYCRLSTCRMTQTYSDNIYWDNASSGTGQGDPGCTDPSCILPVNQSEPPAVRRTVSRELYFGFDGPSGVVATGTELTGATFIAIPDADWGYGDGRVTVLRLAGAGIVRLSLPGRLASSQFDRAFARLRAVSVSAAAVSLKWAGAEAAQPGDSGIAVSRQKHIRGEWMVVEFDLAANDTWRLGRELGGLTLALDLGPGSVVDLDYIVIQP